LQDVIVPAILVTVEPERDGDDLVISSAAIRGNHVMPRAAMQTGAPAVQLGQALVVRTLPNDESKITAEYGEAHIPPYFTADAMRYIVECGFKHLIVDIPSIDRLFDDGKLTNHRIFWNVEAGSHEVNPATRMHSTITELIYVPNEVDDGEYLLNLQIAPFESDCAPSRPILLRTT
jgi:hypothetical protein